MEFRSFPLARLTHYRWSRAVLLVGFTVGAAVILLQAARLTLLGHRESLARAQDNLYSMVRLENPRGNIFDNSGRILATNEKTYTLLFSPYGQRDSDARATLEQVASIAGKPAAEEVDRILTTRPRWTRHVLVEGLGSAEVLPFLERPEEYPGLRVAERYRRTYPYGSTAAHLTGYVGPIQPRETERFTRPRYLPDQRVGRAGLERALEDRLAGHPGKERIVRDARGRRLEDPALVAASEPGEDLTLTIDAQLQGYAMRLLEGLEGSVVFMDAQTGAVLILASRPTYDPLAPAASMVDGQKAGFVNLAVRGLYPPGSTFKIVGAATALREGIRPEERTICRGSYRVGGWLRPFYCDVRTGHGGVDLYTSLEESCNVYYYELAGRVGFEPVSAMADRFGFGKLTGIDLPGEAAGQIAGQASPGPGERTNLVIGQGAMLSTPLQVARAYAAIANGGMLPTPHVVRSIGDEAPNLAPGVATGLGREEIAVITEGLARVVTQGTARRAGFSPAWQVCGKTGTAENAKGGVDAWFAGFYPRNNPRQAFAVHVFEAEGHGGDIAAPIARELIRAIESGVIPPDAKAAPPATRTAAGAIARDPTGVE